MSWRLLNHIVTALWVLDAVAILILPTRVAITYDSALLGFVTIIILGAIHLTLTAAHDRIAQRL